MKNHFTLSLFIFRRDLRLHDNTALIAALSESDAVIPCFIFDNRQIHLDHNRYFGDKPFLFLLESLADLKKQFEKKAGRLYFFEGIAENNVDDLLTELPIDAVYFNRDYTPFSQQRDANIKKTVEKHNRQCFIFGDALLHEPEEIFKGDRTPYTVYTPFMKKSRELFIPNSTPCSKNNFYTQDIKYHHEKIVTQLLETYHYDASYHGGRTTGLKQLDSISQFEDYTRDRDFPARNICTHLSPHHKFGTVSIRETCQTAKKLPQAGTLINELYWRDFFTHIAFHFPFVFKSAFREQFRKIPWKNDMDKFKRWCNGETGFPIVDAGMRELNQTGFMHNRVRMITASFLVKDLHIDWRWGERYFARQLIDYDPAVNNGNWQWAASTGCDAQPYFRIFNPWLQQKRFDIDGLYVKKWIPELKNISTSHFLSAEKMQTLSIKNYPHPMLDHATASAITKNLYSSTTNSN